MFAYSVETKQLYFLREVWFITALCLISSVSLMIQGFMSGPLVHILVQVCVVICVYLPLFVIIYVPLRPCYDLCVCVRVCVVHCRDMWNEEAGFAVAHVWTSPPSVFMGLVSTSLPFNLRYWLKIRCVVLPAHSKWTVYEQISNLHKVLNQISSCPWNKYCRTSWDIQWERVRVCSKMHTWISYQAAT